MADQTKPVVVSVVPVLNEESTIIKCLSSLCEQTYPHSLHRIYVLDGGSSDLTRDLVEDFISNKKPKTPQISIHDNPGKYVAEARNLALELAPDSTDYLLEIIGHCSVSKTHIETMVKVMTELQISNEQPIGALGVKVVTRDEDLGLVESWIESCLESPLASGNGQFENFSGTERTKVPAFCLHSRKALDDVGGWDTSFITSQDSDISMRLLNAGYQLFRTDEVSVKMAKRTSLLSWSKMGFRYGFWRTKLLKKHQNRTSAREFLPWFGLLLTIALYLARQDFWYFPGLLYLIVLGYEGVRFSILKRNLTMIIGVPIATIILHTFFSLGLVYGIFGKTRSFNDRETNNGNIN